MKFSCALVCDRVVRWCLYAALFLTPLFFLPWTLYAVSLNKQTMLTALVGIAAIAWFTKAIHIGEIAYVKSPMNGWALALVAATAVSMFFSHARTISFMGINGGEVDTVMAIVTFAMLYFLIAGTFQNAEELKRGFMALAAAGTLVVMHSTLQLFGVWIFPWNFAQNAGFNTVGTTNALGLFLGALFVLVFGVAYFDSSEKKGVRLWLVILAAALFLMTVYIGYAPLFIGLAAGMFLLVIADMRGVDKEASRRSLAPLAIAVISVFVLFTLGGVINFTLPRAAVSAEVTPSLSASWNIVKSAARESVRNAVIGSGPATYNYAYAKYRDPALNKSAFWNIRFTQGFNAFLTHLISWGALGTSIFIVFLAAFVREGMRWCLSRRTAPMITVCAATSIYIVFALLVYPHNFTLYFLLFVLAGFLVGARAEDIKNRTVILLTPSSRETFAWSLGMMFVIAGIISYIYVNGERYVAAVQFEKGVAAANAAGSNDTALPLFLAAQSHDPRNDVYLQVLGVALLDRANALAATTTSRTAESQTQFRAMIGAAIDAAERSTEVNPDNAVNWIGLGRMYEAMIPLVGGVATSTFAAYEEARRREPHNPEIPVNSGRAHRAYADTLPKEQRDAEYALASTAFEQSVSLKSDYAPAHFMLAQLFDRRGKADEAIARAKIVRALAPNDVGLLFQLGLLHYEANRLGAAREMFEAAVQLSPQYANALYFVGLVHEKLGNHVLALDAFERVKKLNPDNAEIAAIIDTVRSKRSAISSGGELTPREEKKPSVIEPKKQ